MCVRMCIYIGSAFRSGLHEKPWKIMENVSSVIDGKFPLEKTMWVAPSILLPQYLLKDRNSQVLAPLQISAK